MKIEIVCIGTELLRGSINTNVAYLSEQLSYVGLLPKWETSVEDDFKSLESVLGNALRRADVIIITGGLGPTFDDITRDVASKVFNRKLVYNKSVMQNIVSYCKKRNIKLTPNIKKMTYVMEGSIVFRNDVGTAPGMLLDKEFKGNRKIVVLLPGPPSELIPIFEQKVVPYFTKNVSAPLVKKIVLKVVGLPESQLESIIAPVVKRYSKLKNVSFAILAHNEEIDIKVVLKGEKKDALNRLAYEIKQKLIDCLGNNVFGEYNDTLESVVGDLLNKYNKTIAVAESCTGGLVCNRITNVSGSSAYFLEGLIVYSNKAKIKYLNVKADTLKKYGAVSKETAKEMAKGVRKKSGASFGLSVTGIAGPKGGSKKKPVGLVFIGIDSSYGANVFKYIFSGDRSIIKCQAATACLDVIRRELIK